MIVRPRVMIAGFPSTENPLSVTPPNLEATDIPITAKAAPMRMVSRIAAMNLSPNLEARFPAIMISSGCGEV